MLKVTMVHVVALCSSAVCFIVDVTIGGSGAAGEGKVHIQRFIARRRHIAMAFLAGLGSLVVVGGTAIAVHVTSSSGGDVEQHFISQDTAIVVPTTSGWHDIPNTTFTATVPDTGPEIAHITFSGESRCVAANWCAVRAIVISGANGATVEMLPASGTNFAFDSGGQRGARSFSRTIELSGGSEGITYTFKLQAQIIGGSDASTFRLDDYLTQLELSRKT